MAGASWITPRRREIALVWVLALVSVLICNGGIWADQDLEYKLWLIKAWAGGHFPDFPPSHHEMRWGINFIGVAWTALLGASPAGYLLLDSLLFATTSAGVYALARNLLSPGAAFLALTLWLINPVVYWMAPHLMPEPYGVFWLVLGFNALYAAYQRDSRLLYAVAMLMFFCLYGAKETNLFFMPGLGLYELFRKRWDRIAIMAGVMGGGFIGETLLVNTFLGEHHLWLGRVQVITGGQHMREMHTIFSHYTIWNIPGRWGFVAETNLDRLAWFSKALYLVFFAACAWIGWRVWGRRESAGPRTPSGDDMVAVIAAMGFSFAFFTTFFIISLNPLILGQPLNDWYLWVMLPPTVLTIAAVADRAPLPAMLTGIRDTVGKAPVLLAIIGIVLVSHASREGIDFLIMKVRRDGFAQPYRIFQVNDYYRASVREPLEQGCTLMFADASAAWSSLMHAFPYGYIEDPLQLYDRRLDGLPVQGDAQVRGWYVSVDDWPQLTQVLYYEPGRRSFLPYAMRLAGPQVPACDRVLYLGHTDINRRDQAIATGSGPTANPPVSVTNAAAVP